MSKRPAKSDRSVDLPDWADDVTPADEVMRKFYAPTGTFKPGPILSPSLDSQSTSPEVTSDSEAAHEAQPQSDAQEEMLDATAVSDAEILARSSGEERQVKPATVAQTPATEAPKEVVNIAFSPPTPAPLRPVETASANSSSLPARSKLDFSAQRVFSSSDFGSYEDFARKWRMFLYPGQMAVMRILYELTHAIGATECFTRYSEIATATKMSRRNCINVVNSLVDRGFVERIEVRNDASAKGIRFRIHLEPTL